MPACKGNPGFFHHKPFFSGCMANITKGRAVAPRAADNPLHLTASS